jgi:hypothetical protein
MTIVPLSLTSIDSGGRHCPGLHALEGVRDRAALLDATLDDVLDRLRELEPELYALDDLLGFLEVLAPALVLGAQSLARRRRRRCGGGSGRDLGRGGGLGSSVAACCDDDGG